MKNVLFFTFWNSCFYNLERRFIVLEYGERHYPCLYCLKKTGWYNGHFWTKTRSYPLCKTVNFSTFLTSRFYSLETSFFVLEYRKRFCFYGLEKSLLLPKKKTLIKNVNFLTFWTSCFYSLERSFFVLVYRERHFPCQYCLKKTGWYNGHFWTKTMS